MECHASSTLCWLYKIVANIFNSDLINGLAYWLYDNAVAISHRSYINTYELTWLLSLIILIVSLTCNNKKDVHIHKTLLLFSIMKIQFAIYTILLTALSSSHYRCASSILRPLSILFLVIDVISHAIFWTFFRSLYDAVLDKKLVTGSALLFFIYSCMTTIMQNHAYTILLIFIWTCFLTIYEDILDEKAVVLSIILLFGVAYLMSTLSIYTVIQHLFRYALFLLIFLAFHASFPLKYINVVEQIKRVVTVY